MIIDIMVGPGNMEGPCTGETYKRAIHHPPPSRFYIEMLPPSKHGFGMRICPITRSDRSSTSSTGSSISEYEIWRKWEDCLWFQDVLELEYQRMARQKKKRLLAGKGIKKGGFYKQDFASSFESLPPGPDPNSVAQNIHSYVPKLTKKGTLFRASQSTTDQRQAELTAFVQSLFRDDPPALLKELREDRLVTDFFAYWQKDYDLANKDGTPSRPGKERSSLTPSILSSYFPSSTAPTIVESSSPSKPSRSSRPRSLSSSSSSSPRSSLSSSSSMAEDVSSMHHTLASDRSPSLLEALPEDREVASPSVSPRSRNRNTHVYGNLEGVDIRGVRESWQTTASASTYLEGLNMSLPDNSIREQSRMSVTSVATFMTNSSADAVVPRTFIAQAATKTDSRRSASVEPYHRRVSVPSSVLTSDDDADDEGTTMSLYDAFPVPSFHLPSPLVRRRALAQKKAPSPVAPSGPVGEDDEDDGEDSSSSPDDPITPITPSFVPPSPTSSISSNTRSMKTITPRAGKFTNGLPSPTISIASSRLSSVTMRNADTPVPPSPSSTIFSSSAASDMSSLSPQITIKAAHNECIILLRIPKETPFSVIRDRIKEKFMTQENVSLTGSFTLAILLPTVRSPTPSGRNRSNSLSSMGGQLKLLLAQADWERALSANDGNKLTVRVLDTLS